MMLCNLFSKIIVAALILINLAGCAEESEAQQHSKSAGDNVFAKSNLVAWCIVPFDSVNRGPEERSQMLRELGIQKLAYDWRDNHIPTFDDEINALKKNNIHLQAFWLANDSNLNSQGVNAVFDVLSRNNIKTQIWYLYQPHKGFDQLSQDEKVEAVSKTVKTLATRADSIGCTIGLYNHNRWYGEPENQLAVLKKVNMKNVGIVYNFNHAQDHIDRFADFYPKILPHLIALNLAGLKRGDQHIYPIGAGDGERDMIELVWKSDYSGPIGIINEDTHPDAKVGLQMNMAGLKKVLTAIGNKEAADTY